MISASRKRGMVMPRKETKRQQGIDPGILARRRQDAEADAEQRCQEVAGQRDGDGAAAGAAAITSADGLVVGVGLAEIAAQTMPQIQRKYCSDQRVVQAMRLAVGFGGGGARPRRVALPWHDHVGADEVAIVARRGLDDDEGDDAHHDQDRDRLQHADAKETAASAGHLAVSEGREGRCPAGGRSSAAPGQSGGNP